MSAVRYASCLLVSFWYGTVRSRTPDSLIGSGFRWLPAQKPLLRAARRPRGFLGGTTCLIRPQLFSTLQANPFPYPPSTSNLYRNTRCTILSERRSGRSNTLASVCWRWLVNTTFHSTPLFLLKPRTSPGTSTLQAEPPPPPARTAFRSLRASLRLSRGSIIIIIMIIIVATARLSFGQPSSLDHGLRKQWI